MYNKKISYHGIGKDILQECYINRNKESEWNYEHISSKCQEFDTKGNKLNNIMNKFNWEDCQEERIFFPLYNTAPGYPDWFKELTEEELKHSSSYLKPLIDKAFELKSVITLEDFTQLNYFIPMIIPFKNMFFFLKCILVKSFVLKYKILFLILRINCISSVKHIKS